MSTISANEESTAAVVQRHWDAYRRGDVSALLADYADDAVLITAVTGVVRGRAAIGAVLESVFREVFPVAVSRFTLQQTLVAGEIAFIQWAVETPVLRTRAASDTLIVRDGRIVAQTGAVTVEPVAESHR
jgi:uncharacterized protein (TIGR02246 family)